MRPNTLIVILVVMEHTDENRLQWLPILLEALFVVLGVVLAFAANEWREGRNEKKHAQTALEGIINELEVNRSAVESSLLYHYHLTDTLRQIYSQNPVLGEVIVHPDGQIFSRGYIAPAALLSTAWEAANATDAVAAMAYTDVLKLSQIYQSQRRYEQQVQQSGQLIYTKLFNEGHAGMQRNYGNLSTILSAFWYQECKLLSSYEDVLTVLSDVEEKELPEICKLVFGR